MKVWAAIGAVVLTMGVVGTEATDARQRQPSGELRREAVATVQDAIAAADRTAGLQGNPGQWFGPDQYPPEAIRKGEQGRTIARLAVAADGRVTGCAIEDSSGSAPLDARTCEIAIARIRYTPAKDKRGRRLPSTTLLPVRWVLPVEQRWAVAPWSMGARMRIDGAGKVLGCTVESSGPAPLEVENPCAQFGTAPAAIAKQLRGGAGGDTRDTVIVTRLRPGPEPQEPQAADGKVTGMILVRLAIDATGKVLKCEPLVKQGLFLGMTEICTGELPGPFEATPAGIGDGDRIATLAVVIANPGVPAG